MIFKTLVVPFVERERYSCRDQVPDRQRPNAGRYLGDGRVYDGAGSRVHDGNEWLAQIRFQINACRGVRVLLLAIHIVLTGFFLASFWESRTLWGECSDCDSSGSAEWRCPLAAEVYNSLEGNSPGSRADIIELDGGSGEKGSETPLLR